MTAARPEAPPRTSEPTEGGCAAPGGASVSTCVGLVSAALIAYEIVLMQRMLLERWHHFGFLVISLALLGFGASGTLLALLQPSVRKRPGAWMYGSALGLLAGLIVLPRVGAALPLAVRFIPQDLWCQAGWWGLYALCALVPFLFGAALLGVSLMTAGRSVGRMYAANLIGSAAGALGGALVLSRCPIESGLWPSLALAALAAAILSLAAWRGGAQRDRPWPGFRPAAVLALCGAGIGVEAAWPLAPVYDEHKYGAYLARLSEQGSAQRLAAAADPRGYVEIYESALFHDLPFVATELAPPPMLGVTINGDAAGSVLRIESATQAAVMERTLTAFPYRLVAEKPHVLLLGEIGGANVWLARCFDAERITVVQPNRGLLELLRRHAPALLDGSDLSVRAVEPRRFLESSGGDGAYDLIYIAALEGLGVGGAGLRGLAEDHLATVEGFAACLRLLRPGGALVVCRGVQIPERENIRIFATMTEALESIGTADPAAHMIQVRDYLGVCTLALVSPMDEERREALRRGLRAQNLTAVWWGGIQPNEVNRPDALPGPAGTELDWLHYAAREIVAEPDPARRRARRAAFYAAWMLNVRPAGDDRPFFWDYYKPEGAAELRRVFGALWLMRAELGRLFLLASLTLGSAAAVLLILLPLALQRLLRRRAAGGGRGDNRWSARAAVPGSLAYFLAIGLGFMGIEMALISRATALLGDPVWASAVVIGGVLLLSGLGSLTAVDRLAQSAWLAPLLVAIIAAAACVIGYWPGLRRSAVTVAVCILLAYLMGTPMPVGLRRLDVRAAWLVPWCWGVNGVASVIATSAAIAVAMEWGYRSVFLAATVCYLLAAAAAFALWRRSVCEAVTCDAASVR
jgi:spermidine synthase